MKSGSWSRVLLAAVVLPLTLPATAQTQTAPTATAAQQHEEKLTMKLLGTINGSVYARKSISDQEIAVLAEIVRKPATRAQVRTFALKPLSQLRSENITPEQERALLPLLRDVLRADDATQDPDGFAKMFALDAASRLPNFAKSDLPGVVRSLKNDKREFVRVLAGRLADQRK